MIDNLDLITRNLYHTGQMLELGYNYYSIGRQKA